MKDIELNPYLLNILKGFLSINDSTPVSSEQSEKKTDAQKNFIFLDARFDVFLSSFIEILKVYKEFLSFFLFIIKRRFLQG